MARIPSFKALAMKCRKNEKCWAAALAKKQCGRNLMKKCRDDKKCWHNNTHWSIACLVDGREEEAFLF